MRIVTLNLWGGRNIEQLQPWLSATNADVYCFQEVFSAPEHRGLPFNDDDGHRIDVDLLNTLKTFLPKYTCLFSPGSKGYVNDSQWVGFNIQYGIAIFIRSAWTTPTYVADIVHGSFRSRSRGTPPLSRSAQMIRCLTPEGPVVIGNIHGLWDKKGKSDTKQRFQQARRLKKLLSFTAKADDPIILCGDFNLLPNSATFEKMHNKRLRNLIVEYNITSTRTALYKKDNRFADYIFVNDRLDLRNFLVPQEPVLSDHCPIILDAYPKAKKTKKEEEKHQLMPLMDLY